jgi:cytochrome c
MRKLFVSLLAVLFIAVACAALAQDRGKPEEAKALVKKAVAFLKSEGKEKGLVQIKNPQGPFIYKDLYVYASSMDGTNLGHPYTPAMLGKNYMNLKDADGKLFVKEMVETAKAKGSGTLIYRWTNPQTKKVEKKHSYFEIVPGMDVILTCGYYGD